MSDDKTGLNKGNDRRAFAAGYKAHMFKKADDDTGIDGAYERWSGMGTSEVTCEVLEDAFLEETTGVPMRTTEGPTLASFRDERCTCGLTIRGVCYEAFVDEDCPLHGHELLDAKEAGK